jgi:hypothetical protein
LGGRGGLGRRVASHASVRQLHSVFLREKLLAILVVDKIHHQPVFGMGVECIPVESPVHQAAVNAGLDIEQPVDADGTHIPGLTQGGLKLAKLECVAGLRRGGRIAGNIGAVVGQRRLYCGRQERIVLIKHVGLTRARDQLQREVPALSNGFGCGALDVPVSGVIQVIAEASE